jgi:hypothetical protein
MEPLYGLNLTNRYYTFLAEIQKKIFSCICICQKQILYNARIKDNWNYISFEKINLS